MLGVPLIIHLDVELKREFGHFDAEAAPATVSGEPFAPRAT